MNPSPENPARSTAWLSETVDLSTVRAALAEVEALEDEVRLHVAHVHALLPTEHLGRVWALRDAEERLALAEGQLAQHHFVNELIRRLPEHAVLIRATARALLGESGPAPEPG